jgi:Ca-activated chloride channel family protein
MKGLINNKREVNMKKWKTGTLIIGLAFCLCLMAGKALSQENQNANPPEPKATEGLSPDKSGQAGALNVIDKEGKPLGNCPLKHTDVKAEISGYVARVNVTQEFGNPFKEKIEAIYTFPLSSNGAVDDMLMKVGERTIKGQIKKREEARKIYEAARDSGRVASLLDQERPNIFTQSVANIMPGESVTVMISYVEILKYEDGEYSFNFPMVVGPRYIPGSPTGNEGAPDVRRPDTIGTIVPPKAFGEAERGTGWSPDTTQVPDASKITPPVTPEGTRAGHDISISVNLNAGIPIKRIDSKLHEIDTSNVSDSTKQITLKSKDTIPNKDFILNWEVAGDKIEDAILTTGKDGNGFFTMILQPPKRPLKSEITPKEMVFVIDCSGSMSGYPVETAKQAMKLCIEMMNENDTFNIIGFAAGQLALFDKPQPNTKENMEKGLKFLAERTGGGGTEMLSCINAVLNVPEDSQHLRIVCFMTDGYVGDDMTILGAIKKKLGNARLFPFGIGGSVNRFLLDNMALMGKGEVDYVTLGEPGHRAAERFHERIACPLLTDISIDWGGLEISDIYPKSIPDLFSAKPVVLKGRYTKPGKTEITLKGKIVGKDFSRKIQVVLPENNQANNSLGSIWARARIDDLMSQDWEGVQSGNTKGDVKELITHLGLEFRLMTQYTSFVAVEEMTITEGGKPTTITVPVEMPEGVSYEGVFGATGNEKMKKYQGGYAGAPPPQAQMMLKECDKSESCDEEKPSAPPTPKTPEEKIKARLDTILQGLADKVAKEGKDGNLKLEGFEVKDGKVMVKVFLNDSSEEKLAELKKLGLEIIAEPKAIKMIIARIDVKKLNDLAQLDCVVMVTPATLK